MSGFLPGYVDSVRALSLVNRLNNSGPARRSRHGGVVPESSNIFLISLAESCGSAGLLFLSEEDALDERFFCSSSASTSLQAFANCDRIDLWRSLSSLRVSSTTSV